MKNDLAPVVLTVFKRPWHTEETLISLSKNLLASDSILYVYCDGPKHGATEEDLINIAKVRELAKSKKWCGEVHVIESKNNLGLVRSFVTSITEVINRHGKVIVLEDDQRTSPGFLKYMNEALSLYENDSKVMHISGYMYPAKFDSQNSTFFLSVQSCPGWGTWKRAWDLYNHDVANHINFFGSDKKRIKEFDLGGYAGWYAQLERNIIFPGFSFAVRWYASCIRNGGLSLFPAKSLVQNIGLDGTGEHCAPTTMYHVDAADFLEIKKVEIVENYDIRRSISQYYKKHHNGSLSNKFHLWFENAKGFVRDSLRWPFLRLFPELIENFFGKNVNKNSTISKTGKMHPPFQIWDSEVGDYSYLANNSVVSQTTIGKFCSIGPYFRSGWGIHPLNGISTSPMFYSTSGQNGTILSMSNKVQERKRITIGNDVFIGMNVTILDGVTIGDGAVIGAGCVVSKDVPPYAVVVGVPMKILKFRFNNETIEKLLDIAWWDWPDEKLKEIEKDFFKIQEFIEKN